MSFMYGLMMMIEIRLSYIRYYTHSEWVYEMTTSGAVKNKEFQYTYASINKVQLTEDFCARYDHGYCGMSRLTVSRSDINLN